MDLANAYCGCHMPIGVRIVIGILVALLVIGYAVLGILKLRDRR